jgi:cell division protein FtsL
MAKFNLPFRDIKVEYARSHPLTKVVVIALILVCMAAMITLSWTGSRLRREIAQLRQEAAVLAAENAELKEKIENLDSLEGVENIAEDELEMIDPDTIVIDPNP